MLAVGLDVAEIETQTLGDVEHVAEVQTYGVEQHRGHADFIQGPHVWLRPEWYGCHQRNCTPNLRAPAGSSTDTILFGKKYIVKLDFYGS